MRIFIPLIIFNDFSLRAGMLCSDVFIKKLDGIIRGVVVICPGQNGSSEKIVDDASWKQFSNREGVVLMGLHFASAFEELQSGRGYFKASLGSGEVLQNALKEAGLEDFPLLLYVSGPSDSLFPTKNGEKPGIRVFFGEFSNSPVRSLWKKGADTQMVMGAGDYLSKWPQLIFAGENDL